jgi:phage-related minor tail protein
MRIDFATIGGITAGLFVVGLAIAMSGAVAVFFNMPSFLIVIGGAVAATVLRFPIEEVASAPARARPSLITARGPAICWKNSVSSPRLRAVRARSGLSARRFQIASSHAANK